MTDDLEPGLDRYLTMLRRRWWVIPLAALLVAVLFVGLTSTGYRRTNRVLVSTASPSLTAGNFAVAPLDLTAPIVLPLDQLDELSTDDALSADVGSTVTLSATGRPSDEAALFVATLSVDGTDGQPVSDALEQATARLLSEYTANATRSADLARSSFEAANDATRFRLAELENQLAALEDPDSPLAESIRIERARRADELIGTQVKLAAFDEFVAGLDSSYQVISDPAAQRTDSRLIRAALGLILGALLGLGALMLLALLRKSVSTRRDLERLNAGPLLSAVVTRGGHDRSVTSAAAALAHLESIQNVTEIALVAVDRHTDVERLGREVTEELLRLGIDGARIAPVGNVLSDRDAFAAARASGGFVLVARHGRTLEADVVRGVNELQAAGVVLFGTVLTDVPPTAARSTAL